jgi:uncharacterized protein
MQNFNPLKWFGLAIIRIYWLIPKRHRRSCIFKQTCSQYVYCALQTNGFVAGIKAFMQRFYQCRPTYGVIDIDNQTFVLLNDNTLILKSETNL